MNTKNIITKHKSKDNIIVEKQKPSKIISSINDRLCKNKNTFLKTNSRANMFRPTAKNKEQENNTNLNTPIKSKVNEEVVTDIKDINKSVVKSSKKILSKSVSKKIITGIKRSQLNNKFVKKESVNNINTKKCLRSNSKSSIKIMFKNKASNNLRPKDHINRTLKNAKSTDLDKLDTSSVNTILTKISKSNIKLLENVKINAKDKHQFNQLYKIINFLDKDKNLNNNRNNYRVIL